MTEQINEPAREQNLRPVLAVRAIVDEAYTIWFANLNLWAKLSIIPALVVIGMGALSWFLGPELATTEAVTWQQAVMVLLLSVPIFLSEIPLVTAWHRVILMKGDVVSDRYIVGKREWRYLLKTLFVTLLFVPVGIVVAVAITTLVAVFLGDLKVTQWGGLLLGSLYSVGLGSVIVYFVGFLFLMLPAAAIGRRFSAREALATIKGNRWRLVGIYLTALLPVIVLTYLIEAVIPTAGTTSAWAKEMASYIVMLFFVPVFVGALSITYRELIQKPEAAAGD